MHWIYNPDRLNEVLSDLEHCPEFRPLSANPFYRRTTGEQTCYGDQAYVLLESLSQCGGTGLLPKQGGEKCDTHTRDTFQSPGSTACYQNGLFLLLLERKRHVKINRIRKPFPKDVKLFFYQSACFF